MNIVVFSISMEPITVIDLPLEQVNILNRQKGITLQLSETEYCRLIPIPIQCLDGSEYYVYITPDEEAALTMMNTYLPGQRKDINKAVKLIRKLSTKRKEND